MLRIRDLALFKAIELESESGFAAVAPDGSRRAANQTRTTCRGYTFRLPRQSAA